MVGNHQTYNTQTDRASEEELREKFCYKMFPKVLVDQLDMRVSNIKTSTHPATIHWNMNTG